MITLYQIEYTREMIDFLNSRPEGGWTNAMKKYPMIHADMTVKDEGSEGWLPEFFQHYRAVANIKADTLADAWGIGNAFGGYHTDMVDKGLLEPLLPYIKLKNGHETVHMHSMSVGDICKMNDEYYLCESYGWAKVEVEA